MADSSVTFLTSEDRAGDAALTHFTDLSSQDIIDAARAVKSGSYAPKVADWVTATFYPVGQLVAHSGTLYRTTTAHTSGTFDVTKFTAIGGGGSGGDADTLDGHDSTYFLPTSSAVALPIAESDVTSLVTDLAAKVVKATFPCELGIAVSDETTAITTGMAKVTFRMPYAMTLTSVRASVNTVSSSGIPTVNIKESGTTIFSTKLTIDASEKTSLTAAAAAVLSDTALADDAEMTVDIDVAGTGAKGLKVWLIGTRVV